MSGYTKNILRIATLFLLLLIPIIYALFTAIDLEYSWLKKLAYLWVVIVMLLIPAVFLKARTYFIVEGIFNFFFFPIDIASLYLNRQPTSTAFLQNIIHTDWHEASELIISVWPFCLIVVALWILYFIMAIRVENRLLISSAMRKIIWVSGGLVIIVGLVVFVIFGNMRNKGLSKRELVAYAFDKSFMKFYKIYPYNLYLELFDLAKTNYHQHQLEKRIASFSFGINPQVQDSPCIYILVIGEAVRYDHLGINGYHRNTTPLLARQTNLITFDSAFSQANLTRYSVPLILTRANANDNDRAYQEKSIAGAFIEAGYNVGYFTKQQPSALETRIMKHCNYSFYNTKPDDIDMNYDEELLFQIQEFIMDTAQFAVLHMLGNHFRYEQRYPSTFEVYTPVIGSSFSYLMLKEENKSKLVNAYDNAVLYLDFFLNELITYIDNLNRPSVIIYISDHGESLWDDERKLSLHGSYIESSYEYHVPLLVWYSEEYANLHPKKVETMQANATIPISSDVIFYSMLDIASIEGIVDSTCSICSPHLNPMDSIWIQVGSGDIKYISLHNWE